MQYDGYIDQGIYTFFKALQYVSYVTRLRFKKKEIEKFYVAGNNNLTWN